MRCDSRNVCRIFRIRTTYQWGRLIVITVVNEKRFGIVNGRGNVKIVSE